MGHPLPNPYVFLFHILRLGRLLPSCLNETTQRILAYLFPYDYVHSISCPSPMPPATSTATLVNAPIFLRLLQSPLESNKYQT